MSPTGRTWIALTLLATAGCSPLGEQVRDPSAGANGGFEHTRSGLPVNWLVYSPATVPSGDFELSFDRSEFKEGGQSLRFLVRECSPTGGWRSPGIAQQFPVVPGATCAIRFWVKSAGCDWVASYGGVAAKTGELESVDSSQVDATEWRLVEREVAVPEAFESLRFELSVRSAGSLWLDGFVVEAVAH